MKTATILTFTCTVFLLCAGTARATNVDFFSHDNNDSENDFGNGKNHSDWNSDDGKDGGKDYKNNGNFSPIDFSKWSDKVSHSGDHDDWKYKDGKDGSVPPPLCVSNGPGHDGKWGHDGGDKGKSGHSGDSWKGGDGDGDHDKDDYRHHVSYYKDICDHHDKGGKGHYHGCDPGSQTPAPDSLPMFAAAIALLILRSRAQRLS